MSFCTVGINGFNGDFMTYMSAADLALNDADADMLVSYAKRTLKQTWAPHPLPHKLRTNVNGETWTELPPGNWRLSNP